MTELLSGKCEKSPGSTAVFGYAWSLRDDPREIDRYFQGLRHVLQRRREELGQPEESFRIRLAGRTLRLVFINSRLHAAARPSLAFARAAAEKAGSGEAAGPGEDAVLYTWQDQPYNYFPKLPAGANPKSLCKLDSEWAKVEIPYGGDIFQACNHKTAEYFFCLPPGEFDYSQTVHPLRLLLHTWGQRRGVLLTHAAAVEVNGCGMLICALGGRGKSSLAVSSLLAGHKFAGDDHVLLDEAGRAHLVYSSGYLHREMLERMPSLQAHVIGSHPRRNHKTLFDLMPYAANLKPCIKPVLGLYPRLDLSGGKAGFSPIPAARAIHDLIGSTARLNRAEQDREFKLNLFNRLRGLPFYQITLSTNLDENIKVLETLAKEFKPCTTD